MTETEWIESLTPWPAEFGLGRMQALLRELGDPQRRFESVHVVGTNGKSTATRHIEAFLAREGLRVGAYLSPHVRDWSERIRIDDGEADFGAAVAAIRPAAEQLGATQFEALTAAALNVFADAGVDAAVIEAGLGGRLDATNVVDAPVVLLTNVSREHTEVLGETPEEIAREKLAVAHAASVVVAPDNIYAHLVPASAQLVSGGAREAAQAFLGRPLTQATDVAVELPGRLERRSDGELWDGAHNAAGAEWLVERLPSGRHRTVVASILRDKDADAMLRAFSQRADRLVATESSNPRSLPAEDLARYARPYFEHVLAVPKARDAVELARRLGAPVVVTGSLYLLSDLHGVRAHAVP